MTIRERHRRRRQERGGAAAAELAMLLPVFSYIFMATCDYTRVMYDLVAVAHYARDGALCASDSSFNTAATTSAMASALSQDDVNANRYLEGNVSISKATGTDSGGISYVQVTATYTFTTIGKYPGIPTSVTLSRSVTMAATP